MPKSAPDVLKEFVVALGFKVDAQQFREFQKTFDKVASGVSVIGAAVAATAGVIDRNVTVMARRFENLYYESQQSGASVKSLEAMEYGAQQIGLAAGTTTQQLMTMAQAMRDNPGLKGLLGSFGISTKDRDTADIYSDLIDKLATMPRYQADQYGSMFGFSGSDLNLMIKGQAIAKQARADRKRAFAESGLNPDVLAEQSKDFDNNLRRMEGSFEVFRALMAERFMPAVTWLVDGINKALEIANGLDRKTHGASTYAIGAAGLGVSVGGMKLLKSILGKLGLGGAADTAAKVGAEGVVEAGAVEAGEVAAGGAVAAGGISIAGAALIGAAIAGAIAYALKATGVADKLQKWGEDHSVRKTITAGRTYVQSVVKDPGGAAQKVGSAIGSAITKLEEFAIRGNNPGNMRAWEKGQETFERNGSGTFVKFNSALDGLSAMAGQLMRDGHKGMDTVAQIISSWAPKADHNNTAAYIASVSQKLGVRADQHLNTSDPGTLLKLIHAIIQGEQGRDPYSPNLISQAIQQRLARDGDRYAPASHSISTETHVHIAPGPDAKATANHVGDEQTRVNEDLVRNFLPRVN